MANDKSVPSCTPVTNLKWDDQFYVARVSTNEDCSINAQNLIASLTSKAVAHVTCNFNQDTDVIMGKGIMSFLVDCYFVRDLVSRKQMVEGFMLNGVVDIIEHPMKTIPDTETDIGITLSTILDSDKLILRITCDSSPINVDFYYNIVSIISI